MSRALIKGAFALCLLFMNSPLLMAQEEGIKNIVLVHGAFADGSCWSAVISLLQEGIPRFGCSESSDVITRRCNCN
jgi:hypothetical protein